MSKQSDPKRAGKAGRDYGGASGHSNGSAVCYLDADREGLCECIEAITITGDAVLFARTSDGGALSVRVLSAGRTFAHYPTTSEALNELLSELTRMAAE